MNAQEAADVLGVNRRRHGDLREMLRALTLYPWLNTAEDEKRREAARWALTHWAEYQAECWAPGGTLREGPCLTGRVKSFNPDRGFGFILPDDGGPDVFVHIHDVEATGMKTLVAGQPVTYEIGPARGGRSKAPNLRLLNP